MSTTTHSGSDQAPASPFSVPEAAKLLGRAISQVQEVIVGQEHMVEQLMVGLLGRGHILLEGVPGVAKTLAVRSFATVVGGTFARVQFTPDLVPSDIVGTRIYSASKETFDIELGPVFVNFVLADEINRAPAKVQSAMLELMAEKQVSIGGQTYPAPDPFIVIATQNPVESEGVYPLPEAQRDRFLLKVDVPYPRGNEELEILRRMSVRPPHAEPVLNPQLVRQLQDQASEVFVHNLVAEYIVRLVLATRNPEEFNMGDLESVIQIGCSPRATLGLVAAARAKALIHGRDYVLPTDVQAVAKDVMAHRLVLGFDALADDIAPVDVIDRVLAMVPAPTPVWNQQQRQAQHETGRQVRPGSQSQHAGQYQARPVGSGQPAVGSQPSAQPPRIPAESAYPQQAPSNQGQYGPPQPQGSTQPQGHSQPQGSSQSWGGQAPQQGQPRQYPSAPARWDGDQRS